MSQELNPRNRLAPLDPVIYWSKPQTWVWLPGSDFQVCVYPTFVKILSLKSGLETTFFWHVGAVKDFEGRFDLKKGQLRLVINSEFGHLQIALWTNQNHCPCLEIARYNGRLPLEISWDGNSKQVVSPKSVFSLAEQTLFAQRPLQCQPKALPVIWLGTNKRMNFDSLSHKSCPWTWGYALLMARRWLVTEEKEVALSLGKSDENWSKAWMHDFASCSKGLFCFDSGLRSSWNTGAEKSEVTSLEMFASMAKIFSQKWVEFDLKKESLSLFCQKGFCPPSGRLAFLSEEFSFEFVWRAFRPRTLTLHSKKARTIRLGFDSKVKKWRLKKEFDKERLFLTKDEPHGSNLLDLELQPGAHYGLDRFEY